MCLSSISESHLWVWLLRTGPNYLWVPLTYLAPSFIVRKDSSLLKCDELFVGHLSFKLMMAILNLLDPLVPCFFGWVRSSFSLRSETGGRWIVRGPALCMAQSPLEMVETQLPAPSPALGSGCCKWWNQFEDSRKGWVAVNSWLILLLYDVGCGGITFSSHCSSPGSLL